MLKEETTYIGKVLGSYGLSGHVQIALEPGIILLPAALQVIFLKHGDMLVPYFVEDYVEPDKLKLEEVNRPEDAAGLRNKSIHVKHNAAEINEIEDDSPALFLGFSVYTNHVLVGEIERVEEYPQQWMFFVKKDGGEFMIPFVEDWIEGIEPEAKKIYLNLPEGLITE